MKSVYLDATIPSHFYDDRPDMVMIREYTRRWWRQERRGYRLFVSEATVYEVQSGNYPNRSKTVELIGGIEVLPVDDAIRAISEEYMAEFVMPRGDMGDAVHLAVASHFKMDFLLTWNCRHLSNANKTRHIHAVNGRLGLSTPIITTPMQLIREKE
jgi:hypothetical protein